MNAFAQGLFVNYIWSFELIAILLTIIVVGIAFLNTKDEKEKS
jgi:NADH:ubiquinone oxidoreductase subunit 6 (subunit J)